MMTRACEESAKWVTEIQLRDDKVPGILQSVAYHNNGDPSPSPNSATRSGRSPVSRSKTSTSTTPSVQDAPPHDPASTVWGSKSRPRSVTCGDRRSALQA